MSEPFFVLDDDGKLIGMTESGKPEDFYQCSECGWCWFMARVAFAPEKWPVVAVAPPLVCTDCGKEDTE